MNKKNLYIHIGTGKTGTTSIQNYVAHNLETLNKKHNFHYYITNSSEISNTSHSYCKNFRNAERQNADWLKTVNHNLIELKNNIKSSELNSFLISSEFFPGEKYDEIKHIYDLFSDICNIKIIVYLRRQDEFIWSWYSQVIKTINIYQEMQGCINALVKSGYILDYEKMLEPWENVFGTENILVNVFPPKEDLYKNFCKNFDIETNDEFKIKEEKTNDSLSPEQIVFIQILIARFVLEDETIKSILQKPFNIDFNYTKSLISPTQRKQILSDYEKSNNNVAKKYLNRDKLFDDVSIPDEETWEYPDITKSGYMDKVINYLENIKQEENSN